MSRISDSKMLLEVAYLFDNIANAYSSFERDVDTSLYIGHTEITIEHKDGFTIGRITMENDFPVLEFTAEHYGESPNQRKDN